MPLVRLELRNEYRLGNPDLYRGHSKVEDPRAVLDGVAVSGLVGLLRQLGDLSGFASEIFHDLHEQVVATSARGHSVMARVKRIEAALPQIENAVQRQKSHIHFAYLPGSDWHANVQIKDNHLLCSDVPRFIMDSYEECRDPPRLFLLDKFDRSGAGACLKRYSDPTYFKRALIAKEDKMQKEKKVHKTKAKGSWKLNGQIQHTVSLPYRTSCFHVTSPGADDQSITAETLSTCDMILKSDPGSRSASFDSKIRFSGEDLIVNVNSDGPGETISKETFDFSVNSEEERTTTTPGEHNSIADDNSFNESIQEQTTPRSPSVTWDEKTEILKIENTQICGDNLVQSVENSESSLDVAVQLKQDNESGKTGQSDPEDISVYVRRVPYKEDISPVDGNATTLFTGSNRYDEVTSETDNYVDALNTLKSETDTDSEFQIIREVKPSCINTNQAENIISDIGFPKADIFEDDTSRKSEDLHKEMPSKISYPASSKSSCYSPSDKSVGNDLFRSKECSPPEVSGKMDESKENSLLKVSEEVQVNSLQTCGSIDSDLQAQSPGSDANKVSVVTSDTGTSVDLFENSQTSLCKVSENVDVNCQKSLESCAPDLLAQSPGFGANNLTIDNGEIIDLGKRPETSGSIEEPPVKIWTNGGLLGLQPSKPPDFKTPLVELQNDGSSMKNEKNVPSDECILKNSCSNVGKHGLHKSSISITSNGPLVGQEIHKEKEVYPSYPVSNSNGNQSGNVYEPTKDTLEMEDEKFQKSKSAINFCKGKSLTEKRIAPLEKNELSDFVENPSKALSSEYTCLSASLPGLTRKFIASNTHERALLDERRSLPSSTMPTSNVVVLQERYVSDGNRKKHAKMGSLSYYVPVAIPEEKIEHEHREDMNSSRSNDCLPSPPSPPLEHMKISFHPINNMVSSRLRLEFPDGPLHESIEELMFPSFQLLQESDVSVHHSSSDSDDDTFCRSSPSYSENFPSNNSDSDYELWKPEERQGGANYDAVNVLDPVSSTASISSSAYFKKTNCYQEHVENNNGNAAVEESSIYFRSDDVLDLPCLDSMESSLGRIEGKCGFENRNSQESLRTDNEQAVTAQLPPLPPIQWRVSKPSVPYLEDETDGRFEVPGDSTNLEHQKSIKEVSEQNICRLQLPQSAAHIKKPNVQHTTSLIDSHNVIGNRGGHQAANAKKIDEGGDFLHQIRSKSFNLRQTVPTKGGYAPTPTTNTRIAAILEKANVIRQAVVSSDDGGDENWSDN